MSISKEFLEKALSDNLELSDVDLDETGLHGSHFTVCYKNSRDRNTYEFIRQSDGEFWTYTYDYDPESYPEFIEIVKEVAQKLNLLIDDPQTGKENLRPENINMDEIGEIFEAQRNTIDRLPEILKKAELEVSSYENPMKKYDEMRDALINKYEPLGYYVDNIMWGTDKEDAVSYYCIWILTEPTVFPPVEDVYIFLDKDVKEDSEFFKIKLRELALLVPEKVKKVESPVLHYIAEGIDQFELKEKIIENTVRAQ